MSKSSACMNRGRQALAAAVLLLAAFGFLVAASGEAAAQSEIKIGVIMPITGREGKPGTYQREGIQLAMKQINDAGGLQVGNKKLPVKEVFYDDGSDSA
ncbi:MAG: ABC transporter substrate-binding protein, partial [Terriglobales bacterium]